MSSTTNEVVRAYAPATVSNLGPGFDVLGLAVRGPGDIVTARRSPEPGVRLTRISGDGGKLSRDPQANTAGIAALATLQKAGIDQGVELELDKGMPIGSGLGSSAASAVAAAFAVNQLVGSPLRKVELIEPCLLAEASVAGRHADNVAPCLLGGLVLVRAVDPIDIVRLPVPEGLIMVLAVPDFELETRKARAALPAQVTLHQMVRATANLASFVSACYSGDIDLLARCVVDDVVEPVRAALIPGAVQVMQAARSCGVIATSISGAGPTIFAIAHSMEVGRRAGQAMVDAFAQAGVRASVTLSPIDCPGVRRL